MDTEAIQISDPTHVHSDPDVYWTITNIREAAPEVLSPLCRSIWVDRGELANRQTWHDFGVVPRRELSVPERYRDRALACFFGRQAMNVDHMRALAHKLPGITGDDFERDMLGGVRQDAPEHPGAGWRIPMILMKLPLALTRLGARTQRHHHEMLAWWRSSVLPESRTTDPSELLLEAADRFQRTMRLQVCVRFALQGFHSFIVKAADKLGRELVDTATEGFGQTPELDMANHLWQLSTNQIELSAFLWEHGYHGPNEGNVYTRSWREDPTALQAVVASYANRGAAESPSSLAAKKVEARAQAERALLAAVPRGRRAAFRGALRGLGNRIRDLELCKSSLLMSLDGVRAAARDRGRELVRQGVLADADDAFFFTVDELTAPTLDRPRSTAKARRYNYERNRARDLPVTFHGVPEPVAALQAGEPGQVVKGIPAASGVVEGRARVVSSLADADLAEGDVLVCRFTDPSWTVIFPLVRAVVIDVGGMASHGAIIAREMGIPCVIGTGNGTAAIPDGRLVRVDGGEGVVEILDEGP